MRISPLLLVLILAGCSSTPSNERYDLADDVAPGGRLQPYAAVGPSIGIIMDEADLILTTYEDTTVEIGADVRAGANYMLTENIGAFLEYRFTYFNVESSDSIFGIPIDSETDLSTHHVQFGVTFWF